MSSPGQMSELDGIICMLLSSRIWIDAWWQYLRRYRKTTISILLSFWKIIIWIYLDVNECLVDENLCDEGDCINTQGSFKCECPTGYVLSSDGKKCVDVRKELCFNTFRNGGRGSCSDPRTTTMTKTQCCCTMGGAWGNACEKCPSEGTRKSPKVILPYNQNSSWFLNF